MSSLSRPSLQEFETARRRIATVVRRTPLVPLHSYGDGGDILVKPEIHQAVTSFKIRGVFNAVASLSEEDRRRGVSTVSAGNTAQALAFAARHFGVPARSLMPESAPHSKVEAVRAYGGTPVLVTVDELFRYLEERGWEQEPCAFIHPWTDRAVMTGHGSIGLEILEELPEVDSVFVPVGGGGLIAGVAGALLAAGSSARVIGVEPSGCAALQESFKAGKPQAVECRTICDGVAVPYMTETMFPLLREIVHEVVTVEERDVKAAIKRLALRDKIIAEGAGALAVAAALAYERSRRGLSVCLVTGGSIDPEKLLDILGDSRLEIS